MRKCDLMRQPFMATWVLCLGALLSLTSAKAADDPPDRVARISFLKGEVSLQPGGTTEWAPANLNRPLTTDDQLSLEGDARAELQVGSATIHLGEGAAFSLSELSDNVLQARVTDGAIHLTVRRMQEGETIEIDTPQAAVTITKPGDYRIDVLADGTRTLVKTYEGQCEVAGNRESIRLQAREQISLDEGQAVAAHEAFTPHDDFDRWAQDRNERFTRAASSRYVAPDVIGYEDLDGYGEWTTAADYGSIWYPRIAVGWSPYRDGHWAWISPWGWTWVDNAPWGFAPFHYGRWAYVYGRWGWVPGPVHVHAVYAPALVGWVGGPGFSVSVSFGSSVGWFPLAPHEVYVPGYYCSPHHIHNVNYANTIIVNNTVINRAYVNRSTPIDYRHRNFHDAVTVVTRDAFVSAQPVSNHMVRNRDVGNWQTHNAAPAIAPDRASTLGPRWNANASRTPDHWSRNANRDVITRHAPPQPRASFEQEQRAIHENNNRPLPRGDLSRSARAAAIRTSTGNIEQPAEHRSWFRDQHPDRDPAQAGTRPNASSSQMDNRGRDNFPRERETARIESPRPESSHGESRHGESPRGQESTEPQQQRQFERPVEHQPDRQNHWEPNDRASDRAGDRNQADRRQSDHQFNRQPDQSWQRSREGVERQRPVEHTERAEAPRHYDPPQQREQRQEPMRQAPPAASESRGEQRGGREHRTMER